MRAEKRARSFRIKSGLFSRPTGGPMRTRTLWSGLALSLLAAFPVAAAEGPFTVTFVIDMREEIAAKMFDPAKDVVGVRSGTEPLSWYETLAARDADGDGRYEVQVAFPERPFGG